MSSRPSPHDQREPDLGRLQRIMSQLRSPQGGCPWDLEQTLSSLRPYLMEEAYEVLDVMDGDEPELHREELGDLLFQVVFQSQIRREAGDFELADVVDGISDKLTRHHPHVFGDEEGGDVQAVASRWEELKRAEGKGRPEDVPRSLPALSRAATVGQKASRQGFDWPDMDGPLDKLSEEMGELKEALADGPEEAVVHELGDLLFATVNVARHAGVDPELALRAATDRFLHRYGSVQAALSQRGLTVEQAGLELLDRLWEEAKG